MGTSDRGAAEEALHRGDLDTALHLAEDAAPGDRAAARVASVVHGLHGRWPQASERALAAGDTALADLGRALNGGEPTGAAAGGGDSVSEAIATLTAAIGALRSGADPVAGALEAAALLDGRTDAALFESPHVAAALWATELLEADGVATRTARRGVEEGPGGPLLAARHRLALAWVSLMAGAWEATEREYAAAGTTVAARDTLLAAAVDVGVALRLGDVDALRARVDDALNALDRCGPDAVNLAPIAEIIAAAVRLGRADDVRRSHDAANTTLDALSRPPLLVWALAWRMARAGGLLGDVVTVREACKAMEDSGPPSLEADCLLHAAHAWLVVAEGKVEAEPIMAAATRLTEQGLRWEASVLLGSAGVRSDDPGLARSLLSRARELRRSLPELHLTRDAVEANLLTYRERDVAMLVVDGLTHKEIGARLHVSAKTVEHHVARIRQKLGASTRAEMLAGLRDLLDT